MQIRAPSTVGSLARASRWITASRREIRWIAGFGDGGQRLYIVPDLDLVVAVYVGAYGAPPAVGEIVMKQYVLPAFS
jgi:CubicO group peptidase (beta-lactamase class C family)